MKEAFSLEVTDVNFQPIHERGRVSLKHRTLSEHATKNDANLALPIMIRGLRRGLYELSIKPQSYRTARMFVQVPTKHLSIVLVVKPMHVRPSFPDEIDSRITDILGRSNITFESLRNTQKAGLLNIAAKSFVAPIQKKDGILEHVKIQSIHPDRIFVEVPEVVFTRVKNNLAFVPVSSSLHETPPYYGPAGSWKTRDSVGGLQLTFFKSLNPGMKQYPLFVADIDIDNSSGLAHAVDVVRHAVTGKGTHPYDIHDLLVGWQGLDPGYTLQPKRNV